MHRLARYRYPLILTLVFLIGELIVNPLGNFPLNDDWSYAKSVLIITQTGAINIGNWAAMTLATHLVWGYLFVKAFGFSFVVLRFSTLVLSFFGMLLMYQLATKIGRSQLIGFFFSLVFCFNPMFFNLSNTYMTDVPFVVLLVIFVYVCWHYFQKSNDVLLLPILVLSIMLVLMRQYGILAPAAFFVAAFFKPQNRWRTVLLALFIFSTVFYTLKQFEIHLAGYLAPWSPYKYSGDQHLTDKAFQMKLYETFLLRYKSILLHVLFYAGPFSLLFLRRAFFRAGWLFSPVLLTASGLLTWFLVSNTVFPKGNIVDNMIVGPETFCSSWKKFERHCNSETFTSIVNALEYVLCTSGFFVLFTSLTVLIVKIKALKIHAFVVLLMMMCGGYFFMIIITTESYFDRYHLPLLLFYMLLIAWLYRNTEVLAWPAYIVMLAFFYAAFFGTRDYMVLNTKRWEAYHFLHNQGIPVRKINAGFEVNCWDEGEWSWWANFYETKKYDYLIQFEPAPGFVLFKAYPFTRYYPYKQDKIAIFVREEKAPLNQPIQEIK